jgi:hypothetical protein
MAEATDHPQGAITPKAEIGAMPAMSESYRPLSLLALAGFGVAVLYAFVVVLGGVVALINRVPWLMPMWTFIIPVAALVVCWAARTRIRDSEGTLSGLAFTTWGLRLALVVGLTYAAYYGSTFFAVRSQARACAEQFFDALEKKRPDKAFLLAMGAPMKGVEEDEMRDRLENLYNTPQGPTGGGAYSRFRHSSFVRAIETADGEVGITPVGVTEWGYKDGGYRVVLKYHIATPLSELDVNVETFGRDSKPGEPRGRQWQVDLQKGQTGVVPSTLKLTSRGEDLRQAAQMAWSFASTWQDKINRLEWNEVYLDTRPPAEREQLRKEQPAGWQKLAESDLIRIDAKQFWTGKAQRDDILRHIRDTFRGGKRTFTLRLQQAEMPVIHMSDGRVTARIDSQLTYLDAKGEKPKYVVEGQLVVSAAEDEAQRTPSAWRVEAIEPESGRTPPERPSGPGAPGGM